MRCLLPLLAFATVFAADASAPLRVFLRCGPKTHGPGDHDHPAFARDWQPLLTHAGMKVSVGDADAKGVQTFPSDEELARTDVLVIHRQGGGDFKPDERARVAKFAARGGSFVDKEHAITKAVADFGMKDEIYYDMDLRADIHALATAPTPKKVGDGFEAQTQLWTYEKPGAQRAFVFIPGHTYANFSRPDVKLLLFRGIAWAGRHANPQAFDQAASLQICVFPVPPSTEPEKK